MKALKISLVVIVVLAIGAGIFFWIQSIKEPEKVKAPKNAFTAKIELEIEQLKKNPDNSFCGDFYREIAYHINDFYGQKKFGSNQLENNQWKENLERNLYAAYIEKFIRQVKTILRGSEWNPDALIFIQAEKNELRSSGLLVAGSPVDNEFRAIQTVLDKYNEIVSFISSCNRFKYSETDLSARFPLADVQSKISRTNSLLVNHLGNDFVNNCTRLHVELREIPQALFNKHVWYLENKINNCSDLYSNFNSQIDYSNNLYIPIRAEIEALDNNLYNVLNFDSEYERLLQKWSADNTKAYNHDYK